MEAYRAHINNSPLPPAHALDGCHRSQQACGCPHPRRAWLKPVLEVGSHVRSHSIRKLGHCWEVLSCCEGSSKPTAEIQHLHHLARGRKPGKMIGKPEECLRVAHRSPNVRVRGFDRNDDDSEITSTTSTQPPELSSLVCMRSH